MKELIERLRSEAFFKNGLYNEAADALESLSAEVEIHGSAILKIRKALTGDINSSDDLIELIESLKVENKQISQKLSYQIEVNAVQYAELIWVKRERTAFQDQCIGRNIRDALEREVK